MTRFQGKTVAVVGVSVEGKDTIDFFLQEGCTILCLDMQTEEQLAETIASYAGKPVTFHCGPSYLDALAKADIIVRTPGMNPRMKELTDARARGAEVTSATRLFFELCESSIIGVTGTKGKGTTSTLIYEIILASGQRAYLGGNVGVPLLSRVRSLKKTDWVVYELSSFQLEDMERSPHVAVVLRITQDHLANFDVHASNFHENRDAYVEAKSQIVRHQLPHDIAVLNHGDITSTSFASMTPATKYFFDRYSEEADCYVANHQVNFVEEQKTTVLVGAKDIKLRGDHNLENIAAAALACHAIGIPFETIRQTAMTFDGLEHRLEFVRTFDRVSYFNDSFSTVPETTIAAIESFTEPKILILGGSEKKSDFTEMGKRIAETNVIGAVVIGDMTARIVESLNNADFKGKIITGCQSMQEIIEQVRTLAIPGSVVLLSPACASFGMFKNYKERGKQFKHEVLSLT